MNTNQIKRLFLVLLIPFLLLSSWIYEGKVQNTYLVVCGQDKDRFNCTGIPSEGLPYHHINYSIKISDFHVAPLRSFYEEVISTTAGRKTLSSWEITKSLAEPDNVCSLARLPGYDDIGSKKLWRLNCGFEFSEEFAFASPIIQKKYDDLLIQIDEEKARFEYQWVKAAAQSLLIPPGFLLFAILCFNGLKRLLRFVMHGKQERMT
jgi:hypothetical protein